LKHSSRPTLLILTSSFPLSPDDETCGYVRDFARALSKDFCVEVIAPPENRASPWPSDVFNLKRTRTVIPFELNPFQSSRDLNQLSTGRVWLKLCAVPSLIHFVVTALMLSLKADVVCSHWLIPSGLAGALICRVFRKPHIAIEHSGALHFLLRTGLGRTIAKFIVSNTERVVVVSRDLERKLLAICPDAADKIDVMPMGFGTRIRNNNYVLPVRRDNESRTVLFIGRLTGIKGLDLLLMAMKGMKNVRLIVAGDGEDRPALERFARKLSVDATFLRRVGPRQREQLLSSCDAVVIPSRVLADGRTEGTPVVCLEALAAGCVVVASKSGGLADVIVDGQNGLLFEPGDHRMLLEKLTQALNEDHLRKTVSENARISADPYDWSCSGPRFAKLISNLIVKNGQHGNKRIESSIVLE
jgi:phosphatidylinositol alpha-1,6-mannosyltransferase